MRSRVPLLLSLAVAAALPPLVRANTPVVVQNEAGFEGLEEPTVLYFPATNTFTTGDTFQNHVDEGGGMFRDTLRNEYPTPLSPYAPGPGWWDGDGADPANTDRQRSEPKGIVGLGHQQVNQTFEYSFDFRTDPTFTATSDFCHIFQLKATNGDDSPPLATISLYKNGSGIQGRVDSFSDGASGTPQTETVPTTFNYTAGQWIHFVIRITPCAQGQSTGGIQLSVNGGPFAGITNAAIDLQGSTDFRPKFGFYREISISNGVTNDPVGDSWVEHRTITGYNGSSNVLSWAGGQNNNTWDTAATANFLNGANASTFNTIDQVNFTATTNTTINIAGNVWPDFADVNSSANYTFQPAAVGGGAITGGTLRKDGTGTLTLATINSYPGLTQITNGTLFVTGSVGNSTLVSLTGGTLKLGAANALGTNNTAATDGTQITGGTLDLNGFAVGTEPISVQGTGLNNAGAIINNGASQTTALSNLTLTGDTTLGGSGRWDIRGTNATLSTGGSPFNLTKTGANQISFVATTIDPALANITINNGILAFQTSTSSMGDPTKTLAVAVTGILNVFNTTNTLTKQISLNGGTIWAESGSAVQNNIAGNITLSAIGGTLDAGSAFTGGTLNPSANLNIAAKISTTSGTLIKTGPGTVTLSNPANALAALTDNAGTLNLPVPTKLTALTLAGATNNWTPTLNISTLVVQTTSTTKSATLATLQNQITYATTHTTAGGGIDTTTPLPANQALALIDNAALPTPFTTYAGLPTDTNSAIITPLLLGDTNADGTVNLTDLSTLLNNFGSTTAQWTAGNFDNQPTIDLTDLSDLLNNFGLSNPTPSTFPDGATPAPEPASMVLLFTGGLALMRRRPRFAGSTYPRTPIKANKKGLALHKSLFHGQ